MNDDYIFVIHNGVHFKNVCKWIMDSIASKYMTLHRAIFDTYEVIISCHVHLDDNSIVKTIAMEYIVVERP